MEINIIKYGAVGDGLIENATAIQKTTDVGFEAGGRVIISEEAFKTGSIVLKSNVELHLEKKQCGNGP